MTFPSILIQIRLLILFLSIVKNFKIMGGAVGKIWFALHAIDFPARIEIFWFGHMTSVGHELIATGHFDHLCWVSRYSYLGLGSVVFGGWIGDYRNFIFRNAIKTVWRDSMPGVGHQLVEIGYLDHLCWVRIFISWIWKYWFWMLTWWFLKVHILQNHQLWQHVSTWWDHDCVQTM